MGRISGRDLIDAAKLLAKASPRKPKQAELRRAISSAYYAVFLTISGDGASLLISAKTNPDAWRRLHRAFEHKRLRTQCSNIDRKLNALARVAATFMTLQDARHSADYDPQASFERAEALLRISEAEQAIAAWRSLSRGQRIEFISRCLFPDR